MQRKILIVGGVAGGATAAGRLRRLDENAQIILFERGRYISFANCGLPYHIGGEIARRSALILQTPAQLAARYALDIRTRQEVLSIDRQRQVVRVRDHQEGREYEESYDTLLLSPGAEPLRPPLPGVDHPRILTLRNLDDMDQIKHAVQADAKHALVVGGGFIGLEMAENLRRCGLAVTLVEMLPQVLPPLDAEMAAELLGELTRHDVRFHLGTRVTAFEDVAGRVRAQLSSGEHIEVDLVVLSAGVRPETHLARDAGLNLNERGAIIVDEHMCTNDPHIYAVGDAVQVRDAVLDGPTFVPLAGPANRQARIAADNICGRSTSFRGVQGTSIVRVFDLIAASTGPAEKTLKARNVPYRKIYVRTNQHASYFPGAQPMLIKLLFTPDGGRVLGAQIVGREGVDKRIDVLALAIQARMTVFDLEEAELAYAPQYGAAKDPINMVGFVAGNVLRGDVTTIYAEELDADARAGWTIVDVRESVETAAGQVPGVLSIPLGQLRERWREIPTDKPVAIHCASGLRSYIACRILSQKGIPCSNVTGGYLVYELVHGTAAPLNGCC